MIQLTKVIDDPTDYLEKLINLVNFPCFFSLDFHGFMRTQVAEGELKFEFASRNTGIKFFDETSNVFMADWEEGKKVGDFLKGQTLDDIKENWLNVHATELRYNNSGFSPHRLVCAVAYIEPLNNTVEEIFGETEKV